MLIIKAKLQDCSSLVSRTSNQIDKNVVTGTSNLLNFKISSLKHNNISLHLMLD